MPKNGKGFLTAKDILKARDLPREVMDIEEWGGRVIVRALSASEKVEMGLTFHGHGEDPVAVITPDMFPKMVSWALVNEDGTQMFTEVDVVELSRKALEPIQAIAEKSLELSGLLDKDIDEAGKDSKETPSADSPSS